MAKKKATTSLSVSTADNITIAGGGAIAYPEKRQKTALNRR
ncbi:hypothetical protein WH390_01030 [Candidatus Arsenophonus nilaparvatae]